jgi:mono/diheme cytochrome c family protein
MKGLKMKFRHAGLVAVLSIAFISACVAGTNKFAESANVTAVTAPVPMVVAATEATPVSEPAAMVGADGFPLPTQKKKSTAPAIPALGSLQSPLEVAATAAKGSLKNPYSYTTMNSDLVEAGKKKYMGVSCNGCHGGNGGGGMCPPLSNETWVYGADDDTLFRLIALGSDELIKQGYTRKGRENVVGPMPAHGALVKTEDDLWRIIYFIRGNFRGDAKNIQW